MDPTIFPEPEKFNPDRWLMAESDELMHAYLLPFGKGSRACAGQKYVFDYNPRMLKIINPSQYSMDADVLHYIATLPTWRTRDRAV